MRRWIEGVIAGREQGFLAGCYKMAATVPSHLYAMAIHGRHLLYRVGAFKQVKLAVPVVSVGNVVCGGTGKTQLVIALTERLMGNRKVGIVSRGYPVHRGEPMRVSAATDATVCGDEPKLLAKRLPDAIVVVGRDRIAAAKLAIEQGAELIVLDDGMQHRRLRRDVEIGIGPSMGHYLPKGRLRDLPSRLECADLVFEAADLAARPIGLFTLDGEEMEVPKKVALFCGIGNPERFVKTVKEMGCEVVHTRFLADHEAIGRRGLDTLSQGVDAVLCTEKDRVKLNGNFPYLVGWVKSEIKITGKREAWEMTLKKIGCL